MKKYSDIEYAKILYGLEQATSRHSHNVEKICDQYLLFLKKNRALHRLRNILNKYTMYVKKQKNTTDISFTSKRAFLDDYASDISHIVGDNTAVHHTVNHALLGGVKVKTDNVIYDGTVDAKLHHLKTQLLKGI